MELSFGRYFVEVLSVSFVVYLLLLTPFIYLAPPIPQEPLGGGPSPSGEYEIIETSRISTGEATVSIFSQSIRHNRSSITFHIDNSMNRASKEELRISITFQIPESTVENSTYNVERVGNRRYSRTVLLNASEGTEGNITLKHLTDSSKQASFHVKFSPVNSSRVTNIDSYLEVKPAEVGTLNGTSRPTSETKDVWEKSMEGLRTIFHPFPQRIHEPLSPIQLFVLVVTTSSSLAVVTLIDTRMYPEQEDLKPQERLIAGVSVGIGIGASFASYIIGSIVWIPLVCITTFVFRRKITATYDGLCNLVTGYR